MEQASVVALWGREAATAIGKVVFGTSTTNVSSYEKMSF